MNEFRTRFFILSAVAVVLVIGSFVAIQKFNEDLKEQLQPQHPDICFPSIQSFDSCKINLAFTPIYSIREQTEIHGSGEIHSSTSGVFVLGFGSASGYVSGSSRVDESLYYYFFTKDEKGGYVLNKIPAFNTVIIENDTTPGIYEVKTNDSRMQIDDNTRIFLPCNATQKEWESVAEPFCQVYQVGIIDNYYRTGTYYLVVPNGTIKEEYNVG